MAPRRGGGGGGSSTGGGGSSGSTCDSDYPCSTEMLYMYGNRYASFYSNSDLYGQLVLSAIWAIALVALFIQLRKAKAGILRLAMGLFLISFIFLAMRYGLLVGDANVPIGYRFESSIVVLLQCLVMPCLFMAIHQQLQSGKLSRLLLWLALSMYAILNLAYAVLDFLLSARALGNFKDTWDWRLSDRDFGLTYTAQEILALKTSATGDGLNPYYVESRVFDAASDDYLYNRGIQIKIGVAADFVALALAVAIAAMVAMLWIRRRPEFTHTIAWLSLASIGMLLSTLFAVVVATHFVLWNWGVVTDGQRWADWIATYPSLDSSHLILPPDGFLDGYRITADGFPIVQALLEPLGIIAACVGIVQVVLGREKKTDWAGQGGSLKT